MEGGDSTVKSNREEHFTRWSKEERRRKCESDGGVVIMMLSLSLLRYNKPSKPSEQQEFLSQQIPI